MFVAQKAWNGALVSLSLKSGVLPERRYKEVVFMHVAHRVGCKGKGSLGEDTKIACRSWGDVR